MNKTGWEGSELGSQQRSSPASVRPTTCPRPVTVATEPDRPDNPACVAADLVLIVPAALDANAGQDAILSFILGACPVGSGSR